MISEFIFESREQLNQAVAERCASQLTSSIEKRGAASFVVPGGTTPTPLFNLLSEIPLAWNKVTVLPSDERWIDVDKAQSNQLLIKKQLLKNKAASAQFIALKNSAKTAVAGEKITEAKLSELNSPHSVVVLGMGNDGHFASLFPDCPQLQAGLDIDQNNKCKAIDATGCPVAGDFPERISLTLTELLNSAVIIVLITGQQKLDIVRKVLQKPPSDALPISVLLSQNKTAVEIYWSE